MKSDRKVFINLPTADVQRAIAFWKALGYAHNPMFTDETSACIVISDAVFIMVMTHSKIRDFTPLAICDTKTHIQAWHCFTCESRDEVDAIIAKAVAGGGSSEAEPTDHGFMYQQGFADPDGHHWELVHMTAMATEG